MVAGGETECGFRDGKASPVDALDTLGALVVGVTAGGGLDTWRQWIADRMREAAARSTLDIHYRDIR